MAVMLLAHDGKLKFDDKLGNVFPDFPNYGRSITIRQLLTHTSGLPDYEELMDAVGKANGPRWTKERQIQDAEVLHLLKQQTRGKFAPGTSWSYSNSGYVVLGLIVAKVSGESFGQFLDHRVFKPCHMTRTLAYISGKNSPPDRAYGHTREANTFLELDQSPTSATLGDGGVYSNLVDLGNWDKALDDGALLSREEMKTTLVAATLRDGSVPHWPKESGDDNLNPGKPVAYGFGWFLDPYKGLPRMWHFGSTQGFRTVIERFTTARVTIIILCNRTDLDPAVLALKAVDSL